MNIIYYPNIICKEGESGPVGRVFKNLKNERPPKLWLLVRSTLEKVETSSNLKDLERQGWVEPIKHIKEPIYEFKIPPKKRKKGVADMPTEVTPPMPSVIMKVLVEKGSRVTKGDGVVVVSAMKMETTLNAPYDGIVTSINTAEGEKAMPGDILVDIEKDEEKEVE